MASTKIPPRLAVLLPPILAPLLGLAGCTSERFTPPGEIGAAPFARRQVASQDQLLGRVGEESVLSSADNRQFGDGDVMAVPSSSSTVDDVSDSAVMVDAVSDAQPLEPAMAPPGDAGGDYSVPPGGVDMDSALGIGADGAATAETSPAGADENGPQDLAQTPVSDPDGLPVTTEGADSGAEQARLPITGPVAIAEGATAQPVVDGIGSDNPVPVAVPEEEEVMEPDPAITGGIPRR